MRVVKCPDVAIFFQPFRTFHFTFQECGNGRPTYKVLQNFGRVSAFSMANENLCIFLRILTHLDLLSIPQSGGKMSKRLGGIIGCKHKASP